MTNKEWFKKAQCEMTFYFGLYSVLGEEWRGKHGMLYRSVDAGVFVAPNNLKL